MFAQLLGRFSPAVFSPGFGFRLLFWSQIRVLVRVHLLISVIKILQFNGIYDDFSCDWPSFGWLLIFQICEGVLLIFCLKLVILVVFAKLELFIVCFFFWG